MHDPDIEIKGMAQAVLRPNRAKRRGTLSPMTMMALDPKE